MLNVHFCSSKSCILKYLLLYFDPHKICNNCLCTSMFCVHVHLYLSFCIEINTAFLALKAHAHHLLGTLPFRINGYLYLLLLDVFSFFSCKYLNAKSFNLVLHKVLNLVFDISSISCSLIFMSSSFKSLITCDSQSFFFGNCF